jgi:hypothetical protein
MNSMSNLAMLMGAAFLASGLIQLAMRGTVDADVIVGAVFLVAGIVVRLTRK